MKLSVILLTFVFLGVAFAGPAGDSKKDKTAVADAKDAKEGRWQGTLIRINKEESTLSVRSAQSNMAGMERTIAYDASTMWTKQGKKAQMDEFKEGSFVIVVGKPDDKGVLHASQIDLRLPR